jgi:hypothetical protein
MIHSFWAGGPVAYAIWLCEHYDAKLRDLQSQLEQCLNDDQRSKYTTEISETQEEYITKIKEIPQLLF